MGKNPNAKKLKEKKHKEKEFSNDIEALEEEAARLGVNVWDLDEVKNAQKKDESDSDEDSGEEEEEE